jgi:trigger factor
VEADTLRQQAERVAEERVKGDLLLEAIAEREGLQVEDGEIEREVERLARDAKSSVREVRKLLAGESGTFGGLRATLLREKTLDWLHAQAQIREEEGSTSGQEP